MGKFVLVKNKRIPLSSITAYSPVYGAKPYLSIVKGSKIEIIYFDSEANLDRQLNYLVGVLDFIAIGNWFVKESTIKWYEPKGLGVKGDKWYINVQTSVRNMLLRVESSTEDEHKKNIEFLDKRLGLIPV